MDGTVLYIHMYMYFTTSLLCVYISRLSPWLPLSLPLSLPPSLLFPPSLPPSLPPSISCLDQPLQNVNAITVLVPPLHWSPHHFIVPTSPLHCLQVPADLLRQVRYLNECEVKRVNQRSLQKAMRQVQDREPVLKKVGIYMYVYALGSFL